MILHSYKGSSDGARRSALNKELISCMPDGVKTTYEGFLRKVKKAGKMQTSCSSGPAEGGGGGDSRTKGIPLFQVSKRVGVSGLVEVCYRVGKSVISVAKGTKC